MVVSHSNSTSNHNIIGVAAVRPKVVSHSNSTSNHNISLEEARLELLFLIPILHQTTTYERSGKRCALLFLIPILHQTTTAMQTSTSSRCCFSFQFYIKPQPFFGLIDRILVVSHSNSTSNHNLYAVSNRKTQVVSHSNSTSNHNSSRVILISYSLFLIPILHQTTTSRMAVIHILHVTHMTPMHKTSCRTPGKLVGCNFVFQRAIYQKNSSC